jgi:hypothetical protein
MAMTDLEYETRQREAGEMTVLYAVCLIVKRLVNMSDAMLITTALKQEETKERRQDPEGKDEFAQARAWALGYAASKLQEIAGGA